MDDVMTRRGDAEGYFFEDLAVGMSANFGKTVTEADILLFSGVSGDTNPVHLNQVYAEGTRFRGRISHGLLSAGFISAVIGTRLPGPGSIYVSQSLQFKAPVRPGDTVTARVTVAGMMPERNRVVLQTRCYVGDRLVIDGEAVILVPSRATIANSG
ncbi:MaoC family dehydratase [Mycobacterium sp. KBS0706]|uniref:MaoC family dehydratase n=1 Tax=Mycobacterium sp. KBS0706 TaxID=2578109 RepID=UPI00110F9F2E|nr:MaoC family dehydratase [Mycobacterium sp. KBS0706]TSD89852.1 MaoC family dehydratase [Mycobacterium sp. KBS0706]